MMSGECDKCYEHCMDCKCSVKPSCNDYTIKIEGYTTSNPRLKGNEIWIDVTPEWISNNRYSPKRLSLEEGYFPPPWNPNDFQEKTEGWLEFQKRMKEEPEYYNIGIRPLWISVKDRLPDFNGEYRARVLVFGQPTCGTHGDEWAVMEAYFHPKGYFEFGEYDCSLNVSHWMPLPEPPKVPKVALGKHDFPISNKSTKYPEEEK